MAAPHFRTGSTISARLRAATNDGQMVIDALVDIIADKRTAPRDRLEAAKVILDRVEGKAVERSINVNADASPALMEGLGAFSPEQLVEVMKRLATPAAPELEIRTVEALPAPDPQPEVIASAPDPQPEVIASAPDPQPEEQAVISAVDPDSVFGNLG